MKATSHVHRMKLYNTVSLNELIIFQIFQPCVQIIVEDISKFVFNIWGAVTFLQCITHFHVLLKQLFFFTNFFSFKLLWFMMDVLLLAGHYEAMYFWGNRPGPGSACGGLWTEGLQDRLVRTMAAMISSISTDSGLRKLVKISRICHQRLVRPPSSQTYKAWPVPHLYRVSLVGTSLLHPRLASLCGSWTNVLFLWWLLSTKASSPWAQFCVYTFKWEEKKNELLL